MPSDPSRWWYALLPFPVLVGLRYVLDGLITLLLPTAGPSRSEALPVLLVGIAASLVGALVVVTAPLFVAGMLLDIRTLRDHSPWTPHWGYGVLGILPILGLLIDWLALVSIPVTVAYLGLRRYRVGYPLGSGRPADRAATTGSALLSDRPSISRWGYGVMLPPVLELAGGTVLWVVRATGLLRQGSDPLTLLVPVALILIALGLVPLFAVSLYYDAKAVRKASNDLTPNPLAWGLIGLGSLVGLALFRVTLMPFIALVYGIRYYITDIK